MSDLPDKPTRGERFMALTLPLVFLAFVLSHFYFVNFTGLFVADTLMTLVELWLLLGIVVAVLRVVFKNEFKAGLITFFGVLAILSHERLVRIYLRFNSMTGLTPEPLKGTYDVPDDLQYRVLWMLLAAALVASIVVLRSARNLVPLTTFCWRCSLAGVLISLASGAWRIHSVARPVLPLPEARRVEEKPDIYMIVLDAFGRSDVLQRDYGFSNQPLLDALTAQGFKVFPDGRCNYPTTNYSLNCELNFTYLDQESVGLGEKYPSPYPYPLAWLRENNRVSKFLKSQGYEIINVHGGGDFGWPYAVTDQYLHSKEMINSCTFLFLKHTPIYLAFKRYMQVPELDRRRTSAVEALRNLEALPPKLHHPSFVMVHILCPHDPFFLSPDGGRPYADPNFDWEGTRDFATGYAGQAAYLARQMEIIVPQLLKASPKPPVIIVQGDHGPAPIATEKVAQIGQRYPNLCAIYMPGGDYSGFPEDISPVNYFRCIFNRYFDTRLDILPNRSFMVNAQKPFVYEEITQHVPARLR